MGSVASVISELPSSLSEEQAKQVAGLYWDKAKFDIVKNEQGFVSKEDFSKVVKDISNRLRVKYSDVSPFKKNVWEPLLCSSYYDCIHDSGLLKEYCSASTAKRRELLLKSHPLFEYSDNVDLRCRRGCNAHFRDVRASRISFSIVAVDYHLVIKFQKK